MSALVIHENENVFTVIHLELELVAREVKNLDNAALVDECYNISLNYHHFEAIAVINKYYKDGKLLPEDRTTLDNFYILVHTRLCWGDNGKVFDIR